MKNSAFENFSEEALEALDFARCQRPDGSFYGTGGMCRKGSPAGAKEKEAPKGRTKKESTLESTKEQKARRTGEVKEKQAEVRAADKVAKQADKKANADDKAFQKASKVADKAKAAADKDPSNRAKATDARTAKQEADRLQKTASQSDRIAKSLNQDADKANREFQRMVKSAKSDKGRAKNVKINEALASGNKSRLRSAQAEIQKRIASLEKKGQPVPKPLQATAKLLKSRIEG